MKIVAKFMLVEHKRMASSGWMGHEFKFAAQYDPALPEDQRFSKATPNGAMTITVDNPPVVEYLMANVGKQFHLNVEVAEDQ